MTWAKFGSEYFDQLVGMDFPEDLDDACQLTHTQAIHFCYSGEDGSLRFKKSVLRRFATSAKAEAAADALVKAGAWADRGREYEVVHHEAVIRQSLGYQLRERDRARRKMQVKRSGKGQTAPDGTSDVPPDVTRNSVRTQTDRQTDEHPRAPNRSEWIVPHPGEELTHLTTAGERGFPPAPTAGDRPGLGTVPDCTDCGQPLDWPSAAASCAHKHQRHRKATG